MVAEFLEFADDADKGHYPMAGGMYHQTASFRYAYRYLKHQEDQLRQSNG